MSNTQEKIVATAVGLIAALLCLCFLSSCDLDSASAMPRFGIVSYNVQNLFDAEVQGGEYAEFASEDWTAKAYQTRLSRSAGALALAWEGAKASLVANQAEAALALAGSPDIVVLQEIENQAVVDDLNRQISTSWGQPYAFAQVCQASGGGPRTAVMARSIPSKIRTHRLWLNQETTRLVWELQFEDAVVGSLTVFACHWKSKLGPDQGKQARLAAARLVQARIQAKETATYLLVGDLNEDTAHSEGGQLLEQGTDLRNAWMSSNGFSTGALGSYVYRGVWERIDHILYQGSLDLLAFTACNESVLVDSKGFPRRFIKSGTRGVSDHLPIAAIFAPAASTR